MAKKVLVFLQHFFAIPAVRLLFLAAVVGIFLFMMFDKTEKESRRFFFAAPQPLPAAHPALLAIQEQIRKHSRPARDAGSEAHDWAVNAATTASSTADWINSKGEAHLARTNATWQLQHGFSDLVAIGLDDLDGDGALDAWWCDPGDKVCAVQWGTLLGHFSGIQSFPLPDATIDGGAFSDVDGDRHPDFVYREYDQYFWIKMMPVH